MADQKLPSIDIVLDEARRTLDFQFEQLDDLDTKSGIFLGIAGVVLTLLVTGFFVQPNLSNSLLVKIALAPIVASLFLSFASIRIRKWSKPPELEYLRNNYMIKDLQETKLRVIDISLKAISDNDKLLSKRICLVKCSYYTLFAGLVILAVWIGMVVLH